MPVHFSDAEMADRRRRAATTVGDAGFDAILLFKQESMYWSQDAATPALPSHRSPSGSSSAGGRSSNHKAGRQDQAVEFKLLEKGPAETEKKAEVSEWLVSGQ